MDPSRDGPAESQTVGKLLSRAVHRLVDMEEELARAREDLRGVAERLARRTRDERRARASAPLIPEAA